MTPSYLERRKDKFLKDFIETYSKKSTDKDFEEIAIKVATKVLNAFVEIVKEENK